MFKCTFEHSVLVVALVKTITIRDEVYGKLLTVKGKDESFSELFERLVKCTSPSETLRKLRGKVEFKDKQAIVCDLTQNGLKKEVDHP